MKMISIFIIILFPLLNSLIAQDNNVLQYVDPKIGSISGGNTFPGSSMPYGMVKVGPDCDKYHTNSGYRADKNIYGFSHIHVSGTGGGRKYGNVLLQPTSGNINVEDYSSERANEVIKPVYYSVDLTRHNVSVELTTSEKAAIHKYTFNKGGKSNILIDVGHYLTQYRHSPENQSLVGSEIKILNDSTIEGYTRVRGGWNIGKAYTVYFHAVVDKPGKAHGTWKNNEIHAGANTEFDTGEKAGAYFSYDLSRKETIQVKIGLSFLGTEKAKHNLENEIPHWNFNKVRAKAEAAWKTELNKIQVKSTNEDYKTMFYTALYHCMLMPVDRTGENPKWVSEKPYYGDYYAIWDTYRATHPILTLFQKERQVEMVQSLIDIYEHDDYMPDARSGNDNGRTQGGEQL